MEKFEASALARAYSDMVELTRHASFRRYDTQDANALALVDRFAELQARLGVALYNDASLEDARRTATKIDIKYRADMRKLAASMKGAA
jgi:hypothetical protein